VKKDIENRDPVAERERVSVVIVGHVDHGKSTLVGRLLADTHNLPEGKLEAIREQCRRNSKPMEYAYLLDALKDEQAQGITIDSARCFFKTAKRDYIIIDAPGHIEFLKNMVSGAARADAAILVIDAHEGVQENSRRHGYFLSMLGIEQFVVVINKMDLVDYSQSVFDAIEKEYRDFLAPVGMKPMFFIPADSRNGCCVASLSDRMPWYSGMTVFEVFDQFTRGGDVSSNPFRMPVQDVYKFTAMGDNRRIIAGRVESGVLQPGDTVLFSPSNKRAVVKTIEAFGGPAPAKVGPGESAGFTVTEQIYVTRGEMVSREDEMAPRVSTRLRTDIFWLSRQPLTAGRTYTFKLGAAEIPAQLESVQRVLDASTLNVDEKRPSVNRHEVAACVLKTRKPVAFDLYPDNQKMGRFVLVDQYQIAGGGIIREALPDDEAGLREEAFFREKKWVRSEITQNMRAERYGQQAALIVITGQKGAGRKRIAAALERALFDQGRMVYYLGMGSLVHGLDVDISHMDLGKDAAAREYVRRLGEVLHVLLDTGLIVISTALELSGRDLNDIETLIAPNKMLSIHVGGGEEGETNLEFPSPIELQDVLPQIMERLKADGILPEER
jgi:bifunctional enzyme CysN/CysC